MSSLEAGNLALGANHNCGILRKNRIKSSTQSKKLMNAYCDHYLMEMASIAFVFDSRRLHAEQTPDEVLKNDRHLISGQTARTDCLST
ncbi:hypothetical protein RJ640_024160 [Escallonia rubra]|uniref:Rad60/SUMO-like domain-containing protein n=1 Tax=Escallonia rubra TaxID=112253 RepID=A0AA88UAY5_9ASTE|nr:hypothetical protein RJ640_024160 [Escallonia rubra]